MREITQCFLMGIINCFIFFVVDVDAGEVLKICFYRCPIVVRINI